jgi:predicted amidohydrolase YtcJ
MSEAIEPGRCARLLARIPPPLRVRIIPMPGTTRGGRDLDEGSGLSTHPSDRVTISGRKWLLDGVPLEFTFAPRGTHRRPAAPPLDEGFAQLPLLFPEPEMELMLREALTLDQQLMVHVAGYPSARDMLEAMQRTGGSAVWTRRRVRFEHGDGLFPDLLDKATALGVVVVQNPSHLSFFGPGAFQKAQPLRSLLRANIPVALGSDGPANPFLNVMFAVVDKSRPSEAMTREEAVVAFTRTSAFAEQAEGDKGTLEPGKLADLAVLSQDLFSVPVPEIPKTRAVLTLVGGRVVYDAGVLHAAAAR